MLGWCVAESGDPVRGIKLLADAIAALLATQSRHFLSYLLGLLADARMKAHQLEDAMIAVNEAIGLAEENGERYYRAELHRLRGELLAHSPHGKPSEAAAAFQIAVTTAKEQGAAGLGRKAMASLRRWSR